MNSNENPTSSACLSDEAPLLALLKGAPHELTLEEVEMQIATLRSVKVNGHILTQAIEREGKKKAPRGKKEKPQEPLSNLLDGLL
jgi:hypothetical protein